MLFCFLHFRSILDMLLQSLGNIGSELQASPLGSGMLYLSLRTFGSLYRPESVRLEPALMLPSDSTIV